MFAQCKLSVFSKYFIKSFTEETIPNVSRPVISLLVLAVPDSLPCCRLCMRDDNLLCFEIIYIGRIFLPTFCLSMMMFLLLCFIWSQKKSLTQTGENLLCFTFKLWLLSASDSASINLCCLREIVSTSLTFRFQQLEYQVFPFKSLF